MPGIIFADISAFHSRGRCWRKWQLSFACLCIIMRFRALYFNYCSWDTDKILRIIRPERLHNHSHFTNDQSLGSKAVERLLLIDDEPKYFTKPKLLFSRAVKYFRRQIIWRCSALQGPFIVFASVHFEELQRQRHYSFWGEIIDNFDGLLICHAHNSPIRASFSSFTTIQTCRLIHFHVNKYETITMHVFVCDLRE